MRPYIEQQLRYTPDGRLLDENGDAVMMEWERPIMRETARLIAGPEQDPNQPRTKDILNIGFGMGIIDSYIETYHPKTHTIIEMHPSVIEKMFVDGWLRKRHIIPLFGDWRHFVYHLPKYDGIYIDTWNEEFDEFLAFAPNLLKKGGKLSFFNNSKGPENESRLYPLYENLIQELYHVEMHEVGLDHIDSNHYWLDDWKTYHLPILTLKEVSADPSQE